MAAEEIARQVDSSYAYGLIAMNRGVGSLMIGRWKNAQTELDLAEQIFRNQCTGVTWERHTTHNFVLWALLQMGELAELQRRWTAFFRESQERGDLHAVSILTDYYMTMIVLAKNERLESEAELEASVDRRGERPFNLRHSAAVESLVHLNLYRSDITKAWSRITAVWPDYARSMLLGIQMVRINILELRAHTALALAERTKQNAAYMHQAKHDARQLAREGQEGARAHAYYVRTGIAACEEDPVRAVEELNRAISAYDAAQMPLRAQLLRYRLAEIQNDDETRPIRESAESWIKAHGIVSPTRWAGMYAPGFAKIAGESIETSY